MWLFATACSSSAETDGSTEVLATSETPEASPLGAPPATPSTTDSALMPVLGAPGIALSAEPSAAAPTPSAIGTRTLFWLDVSGKVMTSPADDFKAQTLVRSAGQGSDGIAVDVEHGYIYWTNMGVPADDDGTLVRANLDGSGLTTLIAAGGTFTPKQLKLEPRSAKLYWSDREGMRVMRADLDGGQLETLYSAAEGDVARRDADNWCVGISIDPAGGYFYWTQKGPDDAETGSIRRAPLVMAAGEDAAHRTDVQILYQGLAAPVDLDLDREHGFLYWANRGDDTINRAPIEVPAGKTGATRDDREVVVPDVPQAIGVAIDHERSLIYYTDAVGDVGRAALDGSGAEFLLEGRGAFTGIVVVNVP